jgi:iron-sulfur cluster assembly protein
MTPEPKAAMEKGLAATPMGGPAVALTPAAAKQFQSLARDQEVPEEERNLRVSLRVGGCSGYSYEMGFDKANPGDVVEEVEGVRIVLDPKDLQYLRGMTIDFVDTVQEQGFKIVNPNAKSSCGCGQSFQA